MTLQFGGWMVSPLDAGHVWLDGGSMFGSVPKPLWSRMHAPDERNRIRLSMRCMLVQGHGRCVLVDDGMGTKFPPKLEEIYRIEHPVGGMSGALAAHGITPDDITDVVLTHLHFDHAGGSTREQDGRLIPTFPAARYAVQRANWENARSPNPRERASYLPENFEPLMAAGQLDLWDGPHTPWPGFDVLTAEGHTRGQQLVRISGPEGVVYFVADLIPTAAHVRIPFVMGYDMAAVETMQEKRALLERAVSESAWIWLEHDPQVALGKPRADADDFGWAETVAAGAAASTVS